MENENERLLKLFYAGALVDAVFNYERHGILEEVTEEKKLRQEKSAQIQLKQLSIESLPQLYEKFSQIFGCANWSFKDEDGNAAEATTTTCILCALAKKQGTEKPCNLFCINPFKAFAKSLGYELNVTSTLWDGAECCFNHKKIKG